MPESVADLEVRIRRAVAPGFGDRLLDRGLARGLIWRDGQVPPGAPSFSRSLTSDLLDFAHALLAMTLRLRDAAPDHPDLRRYFLVAGEALEAAVHRGDPERIDRGMHRIAAAVSFHLARYAARAYSILPISSSGENLSPSESAVALLLRRQLDDLHNTFSEWLLDARHEDDALASRLADDAEFDEGDAINGVLTTALMRGLALFDHAIATGSVASAEQARESLAAAASAAADLHSVPHWWTLTLAAHLIDDLWDHSLHKQLLTLPPDHTDAEWNQLRHDYILRLRHASRAAIELWPSQVEGAARAIDPLDNLVVALPTSAGKTRIAELCMLRTLASKRRVVYVTPLRALSAQVERDLSSTFGPLGFVVSSLYGSAGIEASDSTTLRNDPIVVSTPEKLDFALRNDPEIINDVGLIVLDEGHMLGPGEREVRYEALVQRLLRRPNAGPRRIVCLSALFPEVEKMSDLVAWIRRDTPGGPVHSDWRATRQRYGWIRWEGHAARLQVQVEGEESFVPRFVESTPPPRGRRKKNFPQNKNELTLASAWQFVSQDKNVLIYSPVKKSVETLGRLVLACVAQEVLPSIGKATKLVQEAMAAGAEWIGADHPAVRCLEHGVAIHHGGLPRPFLTHVERVLRAGDCRITIASPTLAQGLNLSASVLLVPSIWRNRKIIPAVEFANVSGRAGRAFVDLEGLVLHVIWEPGARKRQRAMRDWEELLAQAKAAEIGSGLLQLAVSLFLRIAKVTGLPAQEVVNYVLGQDTAWDYVEIEVAECEAVITETDWERDIASLDAAVLAHLDPETAEDMIDSELDDALEGSLFTRQLARERAADQALIRAFVTARARLIWVRTSQYQRRGYHLAGVGLRAGMYLDAHLNDLVRLLLTAEEAIASMDADSAAIAIADFGELMFQKVPFKPRKQPVRWREALTRWLLGDSSAVVVRTGGDGGVEFLQDGIIYRLTWAMEAVRVHALAVGHPEAGEIGGLAAMATETGSVVRPVITLLRSGLGSREAAHAAVESTDASFLDRAGMLEWLFSNEILAWRQDDEWPTPETRSVWVRFVNSAAAGDRQQWQRDQQFVQVEWLSVDSVPPMNTDVVVEIKSGSDGCVVLLPDFTPVGRFQSALLHPHRDIVHAQVAAQGRVQIKYFGPQSVG